MVKFLGNILKTRKNITVPVNYPSVRWGTFLFPKPQINFPKPKPPIENAAAEVTRILKNHDTRSNNTIAVKTLEQGKRVPLSRKAPPTPIKPVSVLSETWDSSALSNSRENLPLELDEIASNHSSNSSDSSSSGNFEEKKAKHEAWKRDLMKKFSRRNTRDNVVSKAPNLDTLSEKSEPDSQKSRGSYHGGPIVKPESHGRV
jgi:hypothetical protein